MLLLVFFSGPMEVNKVEILEYHWSEASCVKRVKVAVEVGLPPNSVAGCLQIKHISRT